MTKLRNGIAITLALWITFALAFAQAATVASVQKVRIGQTPERVRIVFDMTAAPEFNVILEQEPLRLLVDMPATVEKDVLRKVILNDPFLSSVQIEEPEPGRVRAVFNLNMAVRHNVSKVTGPDRLVVDLFKEYEQKNEREIKPGIRYTSWLRSQSGGPVSAHIIQIAPKAGYVLKPVLSNGAVQGLETLASMSAGARATAAVNGSYFALNGEVIGLLKLGGEIVSTSPIPRTALGIYPDGRLAIAQVNWQGYVDFPGGRVELTGVNRSRGDDELILYTGFYGPTTGTNQYGAEYVIGPDGRVTAIGKGSTPIGPGSVVLSAHGAPVRELYNLKVGDIVSISQSLGPEWDAVVHALGAGPTLVKDGTVYLTTKTEGFGSDVAGGRAPRTAVGITQDRQIIFVVVDGRQASSTGMTLLELALFMQELGAVEAMNLDGGGSSEMVIFDKVVNRPSDGRERKVATALVVVPASIAN